LFLAFEFDELAFKFHGFATGLVFEPHTTLSAYHNKSITQIMLNLFRIMSSLDMVWGRYKSYDLDIRKLIVAILIVKQYFRREIWLN